MTFTYRTTPCSSCNDGRIQVPVRWSGEAYGCLADDLCDDCGGTGEQDAACAHCERIEPLDGQGFCAACAFVPDDISFTETVSDPFWRAA